MSLPEPSEGLGPGGRLVCQAELGSSSFCDVTFPWVPIGEEPLTNVQVERDTCGSG